MKCEEHNYPLKQVLGESYCYFCEIKKMGWDDTPCPHQWFEIRKVSELKKETKVRMDAASNDPIEALNLVSEIKGGLDEHTDHGVILACANCEEQKTIWEK